MASIVTGVRSTVGTAILILVAALHSAACDTSPCPGDTVQVGDRCELQNSQRTRQDENPTMPDGPDKRETPAADSGTPPMAVDAGNTTTDTCPQGPGTEICDEQDNDCDRQVDEGCECVDGAEEECSGKAWGECRPGRRLCRAASGEHARVASKPKRANLRAMARTKTATERRTTTHLAPAAWRAPLGAVRMFAIQTHVRGPAASANRGAEGNG